MKINRKLALRVRWFSFLYPHRYLPLKHRISPLTFVERLEAPMRPLIARSKSKE